MNSIQNKANNECYPYYVNKWSQDLMYKNNVSKKKEKKRYILSSLHPSNKHMNKHSP